MDNVHPRTSRVAQLPNAEQISHPSMGSRYSNLSVAYRNDGAAPHARDVTAQHFDGERSNALQIPGTPERFGQPCRLSDDLILSGQLNSI
jgi:hypothetical protein